MARELRLDVTGDSSGARKALDAAEAALAKANKELRQSEERTDALAIKARKLAEAEEKAADKTRDLAAQAAVLRRKIAETGDETGDLSRKLDKVARDTKFAALATDDYRRAADRAAENAREQARAYDKVADNARQAARAVALLSAANALPGNGGGPARRGGILGTLGSLGASGLSLGGKAAGLAGQGLAGLGESAAGLAGGGTGGAIAVGIGVPIAVGAGTFLGAAAGGGAGLGLAGGAAGLGLVGAWMGDPVKYSAMWNASLDKVQKRWADSSKAFGKPLEDALKQVDIALNNLPIEKALAISQTFVKPLAEGAGQGASAFFNGAVDALDHMQVVVDKVGPKLANFGGDVGDALRAVGLGAEGGADALGDLIDAAGFTAKAVGVMILGFEQSYEKMRNFAKGANDAYHALNPLGGVILDYAYDKLVKLDSEMIHSGRTLDKTGDSAHSLGGSWLDMAIAGARATLETIALNDALTKSRDLALGMADANLGVAQGWLDLNKELKDGKKTLDSNTQAGIDNQKAIESQVKLLEQQRQQAIDSANGNVDAINKANAAYDSGIERIKKMAHEAGLTDDQVNQLLISWGAVPPEVTTDVKTPGLATALDQGISLGNALNNIDGRSYHATVDVSYQGYNPGISLGNLLHHARGGTMPWDGASIVGEHGPELVTLPRGSYISPAEETRKLTSMMSGGGTGGPMGTIRVILQYPDGHVVRDQVVTAASNRGQTVSRFLGV